MTYTVTIRLIGRYMAQHRTEPKIVRRRTFHWKWAAWTYYAWYAVNPRFLGFVLVPTMEEI